MPREHGVSRFRAVAVLTRGWGDFHVSTPRSMFVSLMFERPPDQKTLSSRIVAWFEEGLIALGSDIRAGIAAGPPLRKPDGPGRPVGDPLTPWGTLQLSRLRNGRLRKSGGLF